MANIKEIGIDTSILYRDTSALEDVVKRMNAAINEMISAVERLDSAWDGPSNDAFKQQLMVDAAKLFSLRGTVVALIRCMKGASTEYANGENQVSAIVASIKI